MSDTSGSARWSDRLKRLAEKSEDGFDRIRHKLKSHTGANGEVTVLPFRSHGTLTHLRVRGRVLQDLQQATPSSEDNAFRNLAAMYRRFGSKEVPGTRLEISVGDASEQVVADSEGYFEVRVARPDDHADDGEWIFAKVRIVHSPWGVPSIEDFRAPVLVPASTARYGIISDVDDTVLVTHARRRLSMILRTALGNAATRLPFRGVAELYQALRRGPDGTSANPFFYVSSSPWNLYDFLLDFFELNELPDGPFFLKDLGIGVEAASLRDHKSHKLDTVTSILETHSGLPFVLVGDSGEKDPEIYHEVVKRHPDRVAAVVIRDVTETERDREVEVVMSEISEMGVPATLAEDSAHAARVLAELSLVASDSVDAVEAATLYVSPRDELDETLDEAAATAEGDA